MAVYPSEVSDVSPKIVAKLRLICLGLPEAYEEEAWVGTRWMVRKRNFAHVLEIDGGWPPAYARAAGTDGPVVVVTFRTSDLLYGAFREQGPRFFQAEWGTRWGTKVVGVKLGKRVDWDELEVLIAESYRLLAPKKLAELSTRGRS
jgi:YjbR protein